MKIFLLELSNSYSHSSPPLFTICGIPASGPRASSQASAGSRLKAGILEEPATEGASQASDYLLGAGMMSVA